MLPGNAKCSMTSLADTKHIFRERFMKPRISQLAKTTRGSQTVRALRAQQDYKVAMLGKIQLVGQKYRDKTTLAS